MGIYGNEHVNPAAKAALQKDASDCLISYTDAYQQIGQYVRNLWQSEGETAINNRFHATNPLIEEQPSVIQIRT